MKPACPTTERPTFYSPNQQKTRVSLILNIRDNSGIWEQIIQDLVDDMWELNIRRLIGASQEEED